MTMTQSQVAALVRELASMFIDAVKAGGTMGAPAGVMYAAVCDKLSLTQFNSIMSALVRGGYVRQDGNLYYHVRDMA
jgi:hypothetical protein